MKARERNELVAAISGSGEIKTYRMATTMKRTMTGLARSTTNPKIHPFDYRVMRGPWAAFPCVSLACSHSRVHIVHSAFTFSSLQSVRRRTVHTAPAKSPPSKKRRRPPALPHFPLTVLSGTNTCNTKVTVLTLVTFRFLLFSEKMHVVRR
jgi:hypothetical protein